MMRMIGVMAAVLAFAGPAQANVTAVRNSCAAPNTVEVVTLSINIYEYTFQRLPSGPIYIFAGIVNPTSSSAIRQFPMPSGSYRLTYRQPNTTPVGVWGQNVIIRPHHMVGGACVPIDSRTRSASPTAPVQ